MSTEGWHKVSLENLCDGAAVELFNSALADCHANILDLNTDPSKVREIHLIVKMTPDKKDLKKIGYTVQVTKKLNNVSCAIFESGDTRWKVKYIQSIKQYFEEQLKDSDRRISIIA